MSVYILAYFVIVTCNLVLMPKFPDSYVLVIHCRGLQLSYTPEEQQKIARGQMIRMTILILMFLFTLSNHQRIRLTRSKCHSSIFI